MEGFGKLTWPDGVEYTGQFSQDRFHGQGQYKYDEKKIYIGGWFEGKQHGEGKLILQNKIKIGKWDMGERQKEWIKEITESEFSRLDIESQLSMSLLSGSKNFQLNLNKSS